MKTNDVQSVVTPQRAATFIGLGLLTMAFTLQLLGEDAAGLKAQASKATAAAIRWLANPGSMPTSGVFEGVGKVDIFGDYLPTPKGLPVEHGVLQVGPPNHLNDSQIHGDNERALVDMQMPVAVAAHRGFVWSPYKHGLVQVSGAKPGDCYLCPYTHRPMSIPTDFRDRSDFLAALAAIGASVRDFLPRMALWRRNAVPQPLKPAGPLQQMAERHKVESDKSTAEENQSSSILDLNFKEALIVAGLPGFVRSPYTSPPRLVDAKQAKPGALVTCPYTQRSMIIPAGFQGASAAVTPSLNSNDAAPGEPQQDIPWGARINGRPGFVNSPFAAHHQLVDVSGLPAGMEVKCPYSGKLFRVPPKVEP